MNAQHQAMMAPEDIDRVYQRIGKRIRAVRKARGIGLRELARMIEMSHSAVSLWERGARRPGLDDLIQIAHELGTSLDVLVADTDATDDPGGEAAMLVRQLPQALQRAKVADLRETLKATRAPSTGQTPRFLRRVEPEEDDAE